MRTQYITEGVLVRPLEAPATNFLSTRFYDGRGIVDLLESSSEAHRWMSTLGIEILFPRTSFAPNDDEMAALRQLRDTVESLYRATVDQDAAQAAEHLNSVLASASIQLGALATANDEAAVATWSTEPTNPFVELTAQIAVTAALATTGRAAKHLRKCEAPRCVLYFTQHNSRQHWCSDVCGNRVRVSRASKTK
ncbi:hypothetical protein AXK56_11725 [Tsukamurella pulmonis]|uniref:Conserved protein containing a Zn-ribbon-like motif, possibly RNA-binding n=1 Tax=Tsukamurella pulmonis TaxID=47312 RepID=A0A1H1H4R6_9ACTN|nr:ABATE domain-containing protein [Tsukamurella pulmonis]KXO88048.1 hypothetical protein AXK56_11725 [Tsukamurella pulmonis]SDR20353.1 Conserved protein containing a Zn-ribbon-like motif, possibly RNA-binding [Tsukamurella pulmonis]SUP15969.1 Conserved protein containing a Zn-ribbon-like motif, possibly RNA-binding [Tsukamurella pulmonis]